MLPLSICEIQFWGNSNCESGVTKQSNEVTSNEKTSNGIKIQEVKKKKNPNERKNVKMVVIS